MTPTHSRIPKWIHETAVPLFLLVVCPPTVFVFWHVNVALGGSFSAFWEIVQQQGLVGTVWGIWKPLFFGSATAWALLGSFALFQLILMKIVPGKPFLGPLTPQGNLPIYKANGLACYLITVAVFFIGAFGFGWFSPTIIYDNLGPIFGALNLFSWAFCGFLYFKGKYFPSSTDCGSSGNPLFDYYWGTELYPRIFGWDLKQFTNCRFGMMSWGLILLSYAAKQAQLYGLADSMVVAVGLQLLYITKFFVWETGYLRSLDIMHDRAGFYICWGCLVWVPCIYTSSTLYLVHHPVHLGTQLATAFFLAGAASIIINYLADRQRQVVRAKNGLCMVWRRPPYLIQASFVQNGETKQSLLLASGWWGIARHFHYIPEIAGAFFWAVPALFDNFMPYFYVSYLTILLLDRAFRHDKRCAEKYGEAWDLYCERVPYKMIPYIF
jgi:7-dehydrocholesterol reductase